MAFGRTSGDVLKEATLRRAENIKRIARGAGTTAKRQNRAVANYLQSQIRRGVNISENRALLQILGSTRDENLARNRYISALQRQTLKTLNVAEAARSKTKQRRANISDLRLQRKLSKPQIKYKAGQIITQNGVKYKIKNDGGFERIGFTKIEASRQKRIRTGKATAKDIFAGKKKLSFESNEQVRRALDLDAYNTSIKQRRELTQYLYELNVSQANSFIKILKERAKQKDVLNRDRFTSRFLGDAYRLAKANKSYKIPQRLTPRTTTTESRDLTTSSKVYSWLSKNDPKLYKTLIMYRKKRSILRKRQAQKTTFAGQAELAGLAFFDGVLQNFEGVINIPYTFNQIRKGNITLTGIGRNIINETAGFVKLIKTSPVEAIARIGPELVFLKGTAKVINVIGKVKTNVFVRLNPKFVNVLRKGQKIIVPLSKSKTAVLTVVRKIPLQTISKQLGYAGKTIKVAISSQAQSLLTPVLGRIQKLAKPLGTKIPKSDKVTLNLLKRLDKGVITKKEVGLLDRRLRTKYKVKGVLERSFFADPTGKIRPSRLGILPDQSVTFLDIIKGTFTFRTPNPQILIFKNISVQAFPKSLKNIVKKIKAGKALTRAETNKLLYFQTKKSGKFKPLGFVTRESELTLPQGEILKRIKTVGVTIINDKKVPIVLTEIYKPTKAIKKAINDFLDGKLSKAQIRKLNAELKGKTGINYNLSSTLNSKKYISLKKLSASALISQAKYVRSLSKVRLSRTSKRKATSRTSRGGTSRTSRGGTSRTSRGGTSRTSRGGTSRTSRGGTSRTSRGGTSRTSRGGTSRTSRGGTSRTGKSSTIKFIPKLPKKKDIFKPNSPYNVYVKKGAKYVKFNPKPLKGTDARRVGRWVTNNNIAASYVLKPTRGKTIKVNKRINAPARYFRKPKAKSRLSALSEVEKRFFRLNTGGEKKQISLAKQRKQAFGRKQKRKTIKRK